MLTISLLSACATPSKKSEPWQWQDDKIAHFTISTLMAGAIAHKQMDNPERDCPASLLGISYSMVIGAGKEGYDKYIKKTHWDWEDLAWDLAGSSLGGILGAKCY